jgi:hypothetical protein
VSEAVSLALIQIIPHVIIAVGTVATTVISLANRQKLRVLHIQLNGQQADMILTKEALAHATGLAEGIASEQDAGARREVGG